MYEYTEWKYLNSTVRYRLAIFESFNKVKSANIQIEVKTRKSVIGWHFKKKWRHSLVGNELNKQLAEFVMGLWL
jgi:hypothetical protein